MSDNELIRELFFNLDLIEGRTNFPETETARQAVYEAFDLTGDREDIISRLEDANEMQGFVKGFRFAVKIIIEGMR